MNDSIMALFRRTLMLQIRIQKRYKAKEGVCVTYGQATIRHQIHDISMGGASLYYVDKGRTIGQGFRELSLVLHNRLCLGGLPFEMVSDSVAGEMMFQNKKVRRKSLRFSRLSRLQKQQLKTFISNHTE